MGAKLEHVNMIVRDLDGMIRFLQTAFLEFQVRGEGIGTGGSRWVHIGTDETYVALNQAEVGAEKSFKPYAGMPGVNHLGYEVDDVDSLRSRMLEGGFEESTVPNTHPHRKRVYFYDLEGNDWEFVQYHSENPRERNDYELPDA